MFSGRPSVSKRLSVAEKVAFDKDLKEARKKSVNVERERVLGIGDSKSKALETGASLACRCFLQEATMTEIVEPRGRSLHTKVEEVSGLIFPFFLNFLLRRLRYFLCWQFLVLGPDSVVVMMGARILYMTFMKL